MTSIFLSYSRDDDEPFVKRLYEDLMARGFDVWWDRVSMPKCEQNAGHRRNSGPIETIAENL